MGALLEAESLAPALIRDSSRVESLGEVFTPTWLVERMLDLVPDHAVERLDTKCLDPACGHGQFLLEALRRKLDAVARTLPNRSEYQYDSLAALGSLYGVDIDQDNVSDARERLARLTVGTYRSRYKSVPKTYVQAVDFILDRNIILADFLADEFKVTEFKRAERFGYFVMTTEPFHNAAASNGSLFPGFVTVEGPRHWRYLGRCSSQ